jgi:hypothetical protein
MKIRPRESLPANFQTANFMALLWASFESKIKTPSSINEDGVK